MPEQPKDLDYEIKVANYIFDRMVKAPNFSEAIQKVKDDFMNSTHGYSTSVLFFGRRIEWLREKYPRDIGYEPICQFSFGEKVYNKAHLELTLEIQIRALLETLHRINSLPEGEDIPKSNFVNENYGQFADLGKELNAFLVNEMDKEPDPNFRY